LLFSSSSFGDHRGLHSFPTRRSSDLKKKLAPCVALKAWRARYGLTQKALAEELGISPKAYNFKENGLVSFLENEINYLVERTGRSEEHTSELQSRENLVCRLLLEKKN